MKRMFTLFLTAALAATLLKADERPQCRVTLSSQPTGATVLVDDNERGTTPITLYDIQPGRHHARFRLAGFCEEDRFFDTSEGPAIERTVELKSVKGLLLVKSDPPGATILIDGTARGITPRIFSDLLAKETYQLKLRKAGYLDQVLSIKFKNREPKVIDEKLILDSGAIEVITEPAGAEVIVNGISRGKSPQLVKGISKGRATIKISLEGFEDEIRELALGAGDKQTLSVALRAKPGALHLVSDPEGARFYINDEARGTGPLTIPDILPGEYTIRVEKQGFATQTRIVKIQNGTSAHEEFKLSNVMGRLEVRTSPAGAQLIFDGHLLGSTRSRSNEAEFSDVYPIESILEGEHVLVVRKDGYAESTRHPKIVHSKTSKANVRLKRIFTPDVEIVTVRGTTVGVLVSNTPDEVTLEVSLGINRSFPRSEIKQLNFLNKKSEKAP